MKGLLSLAVALILSVPVFAQYTSAEVKAVEKSKTLYNKGKYDKAISTIKKVQEKHYIDDDLWELRCTYEYDRYQTQFLTDIIEVLGKVAKGKSNFDMSKMKSSAYRQEMLSACTIATLVCGKQEMASSALYDQYIEPSVDTAIAEAAQDEYNKASDDYSNGNYSAAIRAYEKALKVDSVYYQANYRIGLCYFKDEKFEKAIPYFQKANRIEPKKVDPYLNLIACYKQNKQWQEAYNTCIEGIIAYPDTRFFNSLEEMADKLGKTFKRHWMSRSYYPNTISSTTQSPITDATWSYYREAKGKIENNCDDYGIVKKKKSDLTEQKYLEAYSWEYMLKKTDTDDGEFGFARKMMTEGYLDCFTMVSMYHISFSEQYDDFAKHNADRIRTYINTYLVK